MDTLLFEERPSTQAIYSTSKGSEASVKMGCGSLTATDSAGLDVAWFFFLCRMAYTIPV